MIGFIKRVYVWTENKRDMRAMRKMCREWGHRHPGKEPKEHCRRCGAVMS